MGFYREPGEWRGKKTRKLGAWWGKVSGGSRGFNLGSREQRKMSKKQGESTLITEQPKISEGAKIKKMKAGLKN